MRLHEFIENSMEHILQAWEDFARSVETKRLDLDARELRDHAERILRTIAADMRMAQTAKQEVEKAQGRGHQNTSETAAQTHALTRFISGFTMDQMVSEYRALRSSVLSYWLAQEAFEEEHHIRDMIRFNEAIDQALVESIAAYGFAVESTRKMLLAVLSHDLRSPLGAVLMAGGLILRQEGLDEKGRVLAAQVCTSAQRANNMVNDLLDLARCNLGTGIPVQLEPVELNAICNLVVEELSTAFPQSKIILSEEARITGLYDAARIAQVFSNLIGNAICHGDPTLPINLKIYIQKGSACVSVHNWGEVIPTEALPHLFKPEARYSSYASGDRGAASGLGLGLFIAAEIVASHGGRIQVRSSAEEGTTFEVIMVNSSRVAAAPDGDRIG
ncbi:sensor histidine kinase [Pseudomonas soli]|jgi:signal transduction histidine kinase|uniref:histidine kinase n=1 Tax=Pseudomonas soli TaxID=1306993 RepID=A0A2V4HKJ1_9PSED|nr:HAMP domain-containing sensor histidine kinase [Pseudomonas soli]PYB78358.1 two-component sensor histidine kinase [Pseudomonas soli]